MVRNILNLSLRRAISLNYASVGAYYEAQGLSRPNLERNVLARRFISNLQLAQVLATNKSYSIIWRQSDELANVSH